MARSKSISGSKATRKNASNSNKDQNTTSTPANIPDVNAVAVEAVPSEIKPGTKIAPEPRKLEVVKTEPRKVVPINLLPINIEEEIRRRAYELYLQRGPASGSEAEDWLTAEREVRQRYRQQSA